MEKSQKKITVLAAASALSGCLAATTSVLFRDGEALGGHPAARLWLTVFFVASTLALVGMLGAEYSRRRKS